MRGKELVTKTLVAYNMTLTQFAEHIEFPKSTIQTWIDKDKVSRCGEIMLEALIENKELKEKSEAVERVFDLYGLFTPKK